MIEEFHYRVPWRTQSALPGFHASSQTGGEQEFYGHTPLISRPEVHNLDIHASLLDPFQQYQVRTFRQRGIIQLSLIADLSASMAFHNKIQVLADFTEKVAYSAYRTGDHFSFYGCDENIRPEFHTPARWYKGGTPELVEQIKQFKPLGKNNHSLNNIHEHLPRRRALIFFLSDFHMPLSQISTLFDSWAKHDIVPIVLWSKQEYEALPDWGLVRLYDAESGRDRQLFMRPALKQKIALNFTHRRQQLQHLFSRYGRQGFYITDQFQADHLTRYFYEQ